MGEKKGLFSSILRSSFMRSVFTRVLSIFIIVSVLIAGVAFLSYTAEIRRTMLADKRKQLVEVEHTISGRMGEIASVAYNIGKDPCFYLEPVDDSPTSAQDMSHMLGRYLVGNSFIEHLAYCRVAEPDQLYIRTGVRSFKEFFMTGFGMDADSAVNLIGQIHQQNTTQLILTGGGENQYFAYLYPLPQLTAKPRAHVLMLIPVKKVQPLLETLFINGNGETAVFRADGSEIFRTGNLEDEIDLTDFLNGDATETECGAPSGTRYVLQKVVSESNRWTYVAIVRSGDTLSGLANQQIVFIVIILLLLITAMIIMLATILSQYKPISNLAAQVAEAKPLPDADGTMIDERKVLSNTIATLRDDSEQKRKYETAFYEAEAASKAKSAFLSSMSHDIRTPMNAIIGMTAIARKHIGDQAYVDDCLQKVQASSDYLLDIINNVLDMSRIESGRVPIAAEPVMIPALMDNVISLMTSSAEAKSQTLTLRIGELKRAAVIGDNIHIVQVFVNILSNAVKFTPEGGSITIDVRQTGCDDPQAGVYEFAFTDTGVGMPPEFIDHVFDTFTRASGSVTSHTEGTGLGMAIAKNLVELMGGAIRCESELGKGTTFTVTLRMQYADESETAALLAEANAPHGEHTADAEAIDLTGKRILLVEDNAMNRLIAKKIISETGAEIVEAIDGQQAIDAFASSAVNAFDLILMDIQMPIMNGYEATGIIRAMRRSDAATVPIYAMTANTFDEDVRKVKDAGMNGHIGKPYTPQTLYTMLAQALG